jgi:hypothetical protein
MLHSVGLGSPEDFCNTVRGSLKFFDCKKMQEAGMETSLLMAFVFQVWITIYPPQHVSQLWKYVWQLVCNFFKWQDTVSDSISKCLACR